MRRRRSLKKPPILPVQRSRTRFKVAKLTKQQVMDIVKVKMKDMNAAREEAAYRTLVGTARQMGIEVGIDYIGLDMPRA